MERSKYMERILKHKLDGVSLETDNLARIAESLTVDEGSANVTEQTSDELTNLSIEDEACTIDPVGDTTTHYSGEFSYWNFSMRIKHRIEHQTRTSVAQDTQSEDQRSFEYWRAKQLRSGNNHLSAALACCPPAQIARFLVNVFFKYTETYYSFIGKQWLLECLTLFYNDPGALGQKGPAVISIVLTVFAIGTQYAYLDSPKRGSNEQNINDFSEDDIGVTFYQNAVRLLPEIIECSCLESVQACLLFGYYSLPIDASGLGYVYINLAVRLAMQNGMHRQCKNETFTPEMIEIRNRVWWTVYCFERKISIFHGRPLSVLRSDVDTNVPQGSQESQAHSGDVTSSIVSIQLTNFLEDFFHELCRLRQADSKTVPSILSNLLAKKQVMSQWWDSLTQGVLDDKRRHDRVALHLQLEYCLVNMFIGRSFLFKAESPHLKRKQSSRSRPKQCSHDPSTNSEGTESQRCRARDLVSACIESAKQALEVCRQIRDEGPGLSRASYIEYSSCRASLLVLIAYAIQNRSNELREQLQTGLDMIREMAAAGDSARSEVALIEALERALSRLHKEPHASQPSDVHSGALSEYNAFKQWGSMWRNSTADSSEIPSDISPIHYAASVLTAVQPVVSESHSLDHLEQLIDHSVSSPESIRDISMDAIHAFDPVNGLSIFGSGNLSMSSGWPTQTETQVLEQFLATPVSPPRLTTSDGLSNTFSAGDTRGNAWLYRR
ncbi:fungal-specific transcription factor domain-containing protein [Aspergillus avenaceus]|uniref:Fungal-specific transcription factor domain-containing protein n=1 Tax=Aspergillus avenaceus TaxID=36643 RepID=A0A5N6U945_ASPAV|nr:fungal-specific transcription factor domain-containing protein [Aspergillus avenaceus]